MLSADHDIFNKRHRLIYQDMSHPLSHYFIASSHNTWVYVRKIISQNAVFWICFVVFFWTDCSPDLIPADLIPSIDLSR